MLRGNFAAFNAVQLAERLGRPVQGVRKWARRRGCTKSCGPSGAIDLRLLGEVETLLERARCPLSSPVIAMSINRSRRQTQRVLSQLIAAGRLLREFRSGEGRRNPLYSLKVAA